MSDTCDYAFGPPPSPVTVLWNNCLYTGKLDQCEQETEREVAGAHTQAGRGRQGGRHGPQGVVRIPRSCDQVSCGQRAPVAREITQWSLGVRCPAGNGEENWSRAWSHVSLYNQVVEPAHRMVTAHFLCHISLLFSNGPTLLLCLVPWVCLYLYVLLCTVLSCLHVCFFFVACSSHASFATKRLVLFPAVQFTIRLIIRLLFRAQPNHTFNLCALARCSVYSGAWLTATMYRQTSWTWPSTRTSRYSTTAAHRWGLQQGWRPNKTRVPYLFCLARITRRTDIFCWHRKYVFDVTSVGQRSSPWDSVNERQFHLECTCRFPCAQRMMRQIHWRLTNVKTSYQNWPRIHHIVQ